MADFGQTKTEEAERAVGTDERQKAFADFTAGYALKPKAAYPQNSVLGKQKRNLHKGEIPLLQSRLLRRTVCFLSKIF